MTKQDFIQYLSHPEDLNGSTMGELEKLVQEYPYFQLGRMLYLKNLHNENSIAYEKNLHITSAYAPSGKVLYNLIKKRDSKEEVGSKQYTVDKEQPKEILPKLEPIVVLQEMTMNPTDTVSGTKVDEWDIPEKEMLREAYRTSMMVDLLEEKSKAQSEQSLTINHQPSTISQSYSFGDWMKVISGKTPDAAKEAKDFQRKAKSSIIDNFILDQATKTPPKLKAEFYSVENMAKKSLQDDENFVSETLARIYLKQGNLPKALSAYQILLVKHPEKMHIFAPLLEKIKKLLKDQENK
ncbi:MAG: hypothetical protein EPN85_12545 [Bacteroidetes bacterium]|nr:MAG: hypothetical protein EPN85_12545 [Bacteroidota bacterium]